MSGGSYNYLCWKTADEIMSDNGLDDLSRMRDRLLGLGYYDAAKETDILYQEIIHARLVIENRLKRMSSVFHAIEWQDSGDTGIDNTKKEIERWRLPQ